MMRLQKLIVIQAVVFACVLHVFLLTSRNTLQKVMNEIYIFYITNDELEKITFKIS